jgi:hypothetical protein
MLRLYQSYALKAIQASVGDVEGQGKFKGLLC